MCEAKSKHSAWEIATKWAPYAAYEGGIILPNEGTTALRACASDVMPVYIDFVLSRHFAYRWQKIREVETQFGIYADLRIPLFTKTKPLICRSVGIWACYGHKLRKTLLSYNVVNLIGMLSFFAGARSLRQDRRP
jgi:hypothetical protein